MMKRSYLLLLSLLSGILLALAWPARGFPGLLFIGLVPLLYIEDYIYRHKERFIRFTVLFYSFPAFLTWNLLTTWWIYNSTGFGAVLAIILNSLFMVIVFNLFHFTRKKLNNDEAGYASLVFYWMAFEFLHLNWNLNWPWLNFGNGFGSYYKWVQWYEYTGAMGGTLWVMVSNILCFITIRQFVSGYWHKDASDRKREPCRSWLVPVISVLWIIIPILISYLIYFNYKEEKHPVKVVVVQPNLDPYSEQYTVPPPAVIGRIMTLAEPFLESSTNFLAAPESAIQESLWENNINAYGSIQILRDINARYPGLNILIGASTFYEFREGEPLSNTYRTFTDVSKYYDAFNTAILFNVRDSLQLYHKSKLTPGVEVLPSFGKFRFLEKFAIDLGGTVGSLGTDKIRKVFSTVNTVKVSPVICYESVFGEFFAGFVKNGAEVMFIITNDGWWGNTPGHRQHFAFASLRAIETRRCIVRSANTGISGFIDQRGDCSQKTKYWVPAAIKETINANTKMTFYVRHGDYLARIAVVCGGLVLIFALILHFIRRKNLN